MKSPLSPFGERPRAKSSPSDGYMMSSLELLAGVKVRELPVSKLPPEIVQELLRLRRTWPAR